VVQPLSVCVIYFGKKYKKELSNLFLTTCGQFHQHLMSSFCADIVVPKSTNLVQCKYKKAAGKTFV
jgi:hypothetical protein